MKTITVQLQNEYAFLQGGQLHGVLGEFPFDHGDETEWKRPAVIVVPGGAYGMVSKREGESVASAFLAKGFQVFILTYLVASDGVRYPEQLLELASAVDYVKKHAEEFSVNADEIFVVGFSAGGHLVGNLCVEHQNVEEKAGVALDCKPAAVGLAYPVITSKHGHMGSYANLLQGYTDEAKAELCKVLNLDEAVSECTPPAFVWTTAGDTCVPADNAIRYALALARQGVEYELHVFPEGDHGLSTGDKEINVPHGEYLRQITGWIGDCASFFRRYTKEQF